MYSYPVSTAKEPKSRNSFNDHQMHFYSTANHSVRVDLREAVTTGLARDNGLYMPERIPVLPSEFFANIGSLTFAEIAFRVAHSFLSESLPESELKKIVDHTISFDAPLREVEENIFALELFHGPTLAFKDFGARFMSRTLGYFASQQEREIVILVATSGDTGSAVANGFLGVEGTRVVVLYPEGKVSDIQERQFTTLGQNITALEVDGTFDDCQRLVKQAFLDEDLRSSYFLTSANSINIARLIPQSFYYFRAYAQLKDRSRPFIISVPSGNFGNLTAGLLAQRMGLPVEKFIASTNVNDIVPAYLRTGRFNPRPSISTISNAMDVGNPSNFVRMLDLFRHDPEALNSVVEGYDFTDEETRRTMRKVFNEHRYMLDPHGAVAYLGLKTSVEGRRRVNGVFLETAHPAKFKEVVEETLNVRIEIPQPLQQFMEQKKQSVRIAKDFAGFKTFLRETL
jgi:threonine synthase